MLSQAGTKIWAYIPILKNIKKKKKNLFKTNIFFFKIINKQLIVQNIFLKNPFTPYYSNILTNHVLNFCKYRS